MVINMDFCISVMTLEDFEEIKNNLNQDFDDFWSATSLKNEIENISNLNSHYFVVRENDEIVGFAGILIIIDETHIMNIVVKKNKRNLGIGSLLLKYIIDYSEKNKISSITLEVNENNIPAIKLYEKYNFQKVGLRKKYYNNTDDALIMTLKL